jgi:predicted outer membrane repeat protein
MRAKFPRTVITAVAAGLAVAAAGPLAAQSASASVVPKVSVPCNVSTLASDLSGAFSGETLQLAQGCTYVLASALPTISTDLTLLGHSSTLERSLSGSPPDFSILSVTAGDVSISGVNFVNGHAASEGGGIYSDGGNVTVSGGTFSGNDAGDYGGAIYSDGALSVTGSTFTDNAAPGEYGGAIYNDYDATISNSNFRGNTSYEGGAVYTAYNMTLANSVFSENSAEYGGGLYVDDDGISSITASSFLGNEAEYGGGVYNYGYDTTFLDTNFSSNGADSEGGGIDNDYYMTLIGSFFSYNSAPAGGGVYTTSDLVAAEGTSFTSNWAIVGGGLYVEDYATLTGTSFKRNSVDEAGAPSTWMPIT